MPSIIYALRSWSSHRLSTRILPTILMIHVPLLITCSYSIFTLFLFGKNEKSKTLLRKREKELGQNMIERCLTSSSRVGYLILLENFWSHISQQLTQLEALKLGQLFNETGLVNLPGSTTTRSRNSLLRYSSFQNASISFAILDRVSMIVGTNFLRKLKEKDKSCISREFFF